MNKKSLLIIPLSMMLITACSPKGEASSAISTTSENSISSINDKTANFSILTWNVYMGKGNMNTLLAQINDMSPDIIHFQEAIEVYNSVIHPLFEINSLYSITDEKFENADQIATPIIYNQEVFSLEKHGAARLTDSNIGNATKSFSWAVFNYVDTNQKFIDVTFHGAVTRNDYEGLGGYTSAQLIELANQWRVGNVNQILGKVSELKEEYGDIPVVITGDCNFNAESEAYQVLMDNGYLDALTTAAVTENGDNLSSHRLGDGPTKGLPIDHIFGNNFVTFKEAKMLCSEEYYECSDHFPVKAEVEFKK